MQIIDTHCHIHDSEFFLDNREEAYAESRRAGVDMICVGTNVQSSREAVDFAASHDGCYPIVGIHPHDAKDNSADDIRALIEANKSEIIGIGEIGLDYFYNNSQRDAQIERLRQQLQIATDYNLPVSFHVREASSPKGRQSVWRDFWPILDEFPGITGVMHSFTDSQANADEAIKRGFYIGVNGISTFTKIAEQQQLFADLPLQKIVLETDAPFLTPKPFRGTMNIPAYVGRVAEHQAMLKDVPPTDVMRQTTANAKSIFGI